MRSVKFRSFGGPEVLELVDEQPPSPTSGEILIDVHAVSVNPIDWKIRSGMLAHTPIRFPTGTGRDGAGIVTAAEGADADLLGARVCFLAPRGVAAWADEIALPAECVAAIPDALSFADAAALPLAGISAWTGLVTTGDLKAGQRVLIHGGSGGVGSVAVQLARRRGAHVIATCSARNADYVRRLGAHQVVAYDEERFETVVEGVDLVFDLVGGDVHRRSYQVLRPGGALVYLNAAPIEEQVAEFGVRVRMAQVLPDRHALSQAAGLAADPSFRPIVTQVLPFGDFRRAHELSQDGHVPGKIVLTVR